MASFNIELNSKPEQGSGEHALMLRITVDRKHARLNLIYSVKPSQFNSKAKAGNYIRTSHLNHKKINSYLEGKINQAKEAMILLERENKFISANTIRDLMLNPAQVTLSEYMKSHIEDLKRRNNIGNFKKYTSTYNKLIEFSGNKKVHFKEVDSKFLSKFEDHLRVSGNNQTTIAGYLVKIRAVFNMAIKDEVIKMNDNPFLTYKIKNGTVHKDRLNMDLIAKIENLELPEDRKIWHVRNAFIFAFYAAGMRVSDILMLKWKNIDNGRLSYVMLKTKKQHSFALPKQAVAILARYEVGELEDFVFPFMTYRVNLSDPAILYDQLGAKTAIINKNLKEIATLAEINAKISFHTARHSFADVARTKVENLYNLSKTLGHSGLNVTEKYLASFDEKAIDDTLKTIFKE